MRPVADLQQGFQQFVLDDGGDFDRAIVDGPRLDARSRLDIYARAYRSRLVEVLQNDFPALQALAGEDVFTALGHAYIAAHPSRHPNAREFGRSLAPFLAATEPYSAHAVLAEMARLEWAMAEAFYARNDAPLEMASLAALGAEDWPQLALRLRASCRLLALGWSVAPFWAAIDRDEDPEAPQLSPAPRHWVVWRPGLTVRYRELEADEAIALAALQGGSNFGQVCDALAGTLPTEEVAPRAASLLARWIGEQLLAA